MQIKILDRNSKDQENAHEGKNLLMLNIANDKTK